MLITRQQAILEIARRAGRVTVEELAERFDVTPQTIRKDLNDLCDQRLLARVHGGAILSVRRRERRLRGAPHDRGRGEGARSARRAAALIPNDASLFINIGTTTEAVARALRQHAG